MKCKMCGHTLGVFRAEVTACPNCEYVADATQLFKTLEKLEVDKGLQEKIKKELRWRKQKGDTVGKLLPQEQT